MSRCTGCGCLRHSADSFCAACGSELKATSLVGASVDGALDPSAVWLADLGVSLRIVGLLAEAGHYVVEDIVTRSDVDLLETGIGPTGLRHLRAGLDATATRPASLDGSAFRGTTSRPRPGEPSLGASFLDVAARHGLDLERIPVNAFRLSPATRSRLAGARIGTLAEAAALTNVQLVRVIRAPGPDVLRELATAAERLQEPAGLSGMPNEWRIGGGVTASTSDDGVDAPLATLRAGIGRLADNRRTALRLRFGMDGGDRLTLDEAGGRMGVTRERVRQVERRAISELHGLRPRLRSAFDALSEHRQELGIPWRDRRLVASAVVVSALAGWSSGELAVLMAVFADQVDASPGVEDVEEAVVNVLSTSGPLSPAELDLLVRPLLSDDKLAAYPRFSVARRVALLGPGTVGADGLVVLPDGPIDGLSDRRMRRLNALVRVLEEHGPSHYTFIAREIAIILPEGYDLSERDVQSWLGRYPRLFTWAGRGTYGLPSHGVGMTADPSGLLDGDMTDVASTIDGRSRRIGIGDEIETVLRHRGSIPLGELQTHILSRFTVKGSSVPAAILQDARRRFALDDDQVVTLRAG